MSAKPMRRTKRSMPRSSTAMPIARAARCAIISNRPGRAAAPRANRAADEKQRHCTMRILDSHVHSWRIGGPGHAWPDAAWPLIHHDFLPGDLRAEAAGLDLVGGVLVQSQPDDRDTDWMLTLDDPLI